MIGDFAFLSVFGLAFLAIGAVAWRVAIGRFPRGDEWLGIALPLGLGLGGTLLGIAASTVSFVAGLAAVTGLAIASFVMIASSIEARRSLRILPGWLGSKAGLGLLVLIGVLIMPGMFVPVIDGDALCYHLEVARRMVGDDQVRFDPDLHETAYPLLVESLQAIALKCRGPVATRAISFWFGIALAFGSAVLAGTIVRGSARYWAAGLVLLSPVVHCGTISPLNDIALAALCTSSLAVWVVTESSGRSFSLRLALAGILSGFACGVKFPGIVWLVVLTGFLAVAITVREREAGRFPARQLLVSLSIFGFFVLLAGGFWYGRAAVLTGNPVHPYFRQTFGGNGLDEVLEDARKSPFEHLVNIATAPIVMVIAPSRFDSFSHQAGPLFLALIPLGFWQKTSNRWKAFVFMGWALMALCLTQRQSPRFFVTTFALWAAAGAAALDTLRNHARFGYRPARHAAAFAFAGICLLSVSIASFDLARVRVGTMILAGVVSPGEWLEANEPTAKLRAWVDAELPPGAHLIGQDHRGFYWPRRFTMEKAHRRRTDLMTRTNTPDELIDRLRDTGFTHLVMAEPDPVDAVEFDTDLSIRLAPWLERELPLLDVTLPEMDGYVRRYRIFDLYERKAEPASENPHEFARGPEPRAKSATSPKSEVAPRTIQAIVR